MNRLLPLVAIAAILLSACAKKENATEPVDTGGNTSSKNSFVVDGSGFSNASFRGFNDETTAFAASDDESSSGAISFSGTIGNNSTSIFSLSIVVNEVRTGTFTEANSLVTVVTTNGSTMTGSFVMVDGTITISQWDDVGGRCKGTFSGTATDASNGASITITNGKFDCRVVETIE